VTLPGPSGGGFEIEIGCGNGHFLAAYAQRNPAVRLVGVEIKKKRCLKAEEKVRKRGLSNVSIMMGAAEGWIRDLSEGSVDAFHIYFPDPWPKARHRKRRFVSRENIELLHQRLRPGGRVFFSTDFFDYYLQAKVLFLLHGGFSVVPDPAPEEAFSSVYARKFADAMKPVHLMTAVKLPVSR
jgi:tRNA (guanine-N7-)-methyltransferase